MSQLEAPRRLRGRIVEHRRVAPGAGILRFALDGPAPRFAPGQFVQLRTWSGVDPLLGRPFSLLDQGREPGGGEWLSILYQVEGRATSLMGEARTGEPVTAVGPLGRPFTLPARPGPAVIVAGGVGIPPFLLLVRALRAAGREALVLLGARRAERLYLREELAAEGATVRVATEDGSLGRRGWVTELLQEELRARGAGGIGALYACGPSGLLKAVIRLGQEAGVPGQVSLERMMACGFGVCFTCVCPLLAPDGGYRNKRTCLEGPVVPLADLPPEGW